MSVANGQFNWLGSLDSFYKVFAFGVGVLYLSGFLVVAGHLSKFGVATFSILQLQYLVAGVWAFGPFVLVDVIQNVRNRFDRRLAQNSSTVFNWYRFLISALFSGVPIGLFVGLLASLPKFWIGLTWRSFFVWFLFFLAIVSSSYAALGAWRTPREKQSVWMNRDTALFYLSALFAFSLFYVFWFSTHIYLLIPFSWGGGKPLTVEFFENDKSLPQVLQSGPSPNRSVAYKLLATTEKYYVLVANDPKELSIEISRESVAGMVVLEEK